MEPPSNATVDEIVARSTQLITDMEELLHQYRDVLAEIDACCERANRLKATLSDAARNATTDWANRDEEVLAGERSLAEV